MWWKESLQAGLCASPKKPSQSMTQEGQMEPGKTQINARTNAMCMRLRSVKMTWRTLQTRSSHCSMLKTHRN